MALKKVAEKQQINADLAVVSHKPDQINSRMLRMNSNMSVESQTPCPSEKYQLNKFTAKNQRLYLKSISDQISVKKPNVALNHSFGIQEKELKPAPKKIIMIKNKSIIPTA